MLKQLDPVHNVPKVPETLYFLTLVVVNVCPDHSCTKNEGHNGDNIC